MTEITNQYRTATNHRARCAHICGQQHFAQSNLNVRRTDLLWRVLYWDQSSIHEFLTALHCLLHFWPRNCKWHRIQKSAESLSPFHHAPLNRALPVLVRCPNSVLSLCQSCCSGNEPLQSAWRPISLHKQIPKTVPAASVY